MIGCPYMSLRSTLVLILLLGLIACDQPLTEFCGNGYDDDGDFRADCTDPDCADYPDCIVVCGDGACLCV